ncbi:hypothetical protein C8J57DRAFT_1251324 [Mycena rebaudengoi]|nr:hypothetical protein C8J57DRAFT_1251324 [Mycena rebaudengoi]
MLVLLHNDYDAQGGDVPGPIIGNSIDTPWAGDQYDLDEIIDQPSDPKELPVHVKLCVVIGLHGSECDQLLFATKEELLELQGQKLSQRAISLHLGLEETDPTVVRLTEFGMATSNGDQVVAFDTETFLSFRQPVYDRGQREDTVQATAYFRWRQKLSHKDSGDSDNMEEDGWEDEGDDGGEDDDDGGEDDDGGGEYYNRDGGHSRDNLQDTWEDRMEWKVGI